MTFFGVSERKEKELSLRMQQWNVSKSDLEESFIRSSGPGGQNVNKVSTCVVLLHRPSGIRVKCQRERSQIMNRFFARRLLLDEIERRQKGFVQSKIDRVEKIRRQKRRRSKAAKERMLQAKSFHSRKKERRRLTQSNKLGDL